jgi:hypothetical protein
VLSSVVLVWFDVLRLWIWAFWDEDTKLIQRSSTGTSRFVRTWLVSAGAGTLLKHEVQEVDDALRDNGLMKRSVIKTQVTLSRPL